MPFLISSIFNSILIFIFSFCQEAYVAELDAKSGASLKLTILNKKGRIWTMVAGGGASVIYRYMSHTASVSGWYFDNVIVTQCVTLVVAKN